MFFTSRTRPSLTFFLQHPEQSGGHAAGSCYVFAVKNRDGSDAPLLADLPQRLADVLSSWIAASCKVTKVAKDSAVVEAYTPPPPLHVLTHETLGVTISQLLDRKGPDVLPRAIALAQLGHLPCLQRNYAAKSATIFFPPSSINVLLIFSFPDGHTHYRLATFDLLPSLESLADFPFHLSSSAVEGLPRLLLHIGGSDSPPLQPAIARAFADHRAWYKSSQQNNRSKP